MNREYLSFIRSKPCVICGNNSEPHHIRQASRIPHELSGGTGCKSSDFLTIPVCRDHHREIERSLSDFEKNYNFNTSAHIIRLLVEFLKKHVDI